ETQACRVKSAWRLVLCSVGYANRKRPLARSRTMPLTTLFLDLNSYFSSVEQQVQPALRGIPIAVTPVLADSGCCIAASYEAKAYGVKTGTRVREARRLCPQITLVKARPRLYVLMHHRVLEAGAASLALPRVDSTRA